MSKVQKIQKLTAEGLRRIIKEEAAKFGKPESTEDRAKDTEEVDADEYADTLAKKVDYAKSLKNEEVRLTHRLKQIREERARVGRQIASHVEK